ncbi:hypothetical protein RRG08_016578 [Elysia crispata]|uniref:Uncharacterized protein n=1 Tax=Elysia crispata TaxID=231223 RepID=A0AAE1AS64_9GAST|nr:hypothetical protein RRG08_016578 [Elysia crispata]
MSQPQQLSHGEFLQSRDARTMEPDLPFLRELQRTMRSLQPPPARFHGNQIIYVPSKACHQPITFTLEDILTDTHSNVLMTDPFAYWIRRKNTAKRPSPLIV